MKSILTKVIVITIMAGILTSNVFASDYIYPPGTGLTTTATTIDTYK